MANKTTRQTPGVYQRKTKTGIAYDIVATVNGKQKWQRGFRTKALAEAARDQMKVELRNGMVGAASGRLLVRDYLLKRCLPTKEMALNSSESVRSYRYLTARIVEGLGHVRLTQLHQLDIEAFKLNLAKSGTGGNTNFMAYSGLKQSLRQAVRWGLISRNPADQVDAPRRGQHEPPLLDMDAINRILQVADQTPYGTFIYTAVMTGMRWSELVSLRWADIDMAIGIVRIAKSKTARGVRAVQLGPQTVERLREHRIEQMKFYRELGALPGQLVFITQTGTPLLQGNFNARWWQQIRRDAGLPTLHFHHLRHTHSTLLARAGVHPRIAMDRLGHADSKTTMMVYTHTMPDSQEVAASAVEELVSSLQALSRASD